jgi:hypothetical protein
MSDFSLVKLKKKLEEKNKQDLTQEILQLCKLFPQVKEYYQTQTSDSEVILERYKDIIEKEFVEGKARGGPKARLGVAKKAIQDFSKLTKEPTLIADLMLTFVECVSNFNADFRSDVEAYYTSPEGMFEKVLIFIKKNDLLAEFAARTYSIVDNATESWGHFDSLCESYEEVYGEFSR